MSRKFIAVGIGELLWDLLPAGSQLGGAPANFVYHAAALGAQASLISRVGSDPLGIQAVKQLAAMGLSTEFIESDPELPTGTVSVHLAPDGQPSYTIHENVAWDHIHAPPHAQSVAKQADILCFGTLAQRSPTSRATIYSLLKHASPSAVRIFDINLRPPFYSARLIEDSLQFATVLKVNETELPVLADIFRLNGKEQDQILQLVHRFQLRSVCYTRGAGGSLLFREGEWSDLPATPVQVRDTVGAGDAFTAAMALGLLAGWPLLKIHQLATEIAAFVCSQPGGTPTLPEALRRPFGERFSNATPLNR